MTRRTWVETKRSAVKAMSAAEREEYERGYRLTALLATVGEQVRTAREEAGLTQRELAKRMSTSQPAIARLEAGGVGVTVTTLLRAADALDLALTVSLERPAT
jgi:ribosome-binding protein aMBF1 (putative translation factor)